MRNRVLPIILPPSAYRRLELEARSQERDPVQQARWILRQALGERGDDRSAILTTIAHEPEAVGA